MPNPSSSTGAFVTISQAQTMISNWDNQQVSINDANPRSIAFGKSKILDILNQSDCEGIRIYNGIDQGNHVFILVGYDSNGNDMTSGYILETGLPCPSYCAPSTSLG